MKMIRVIKAQDSFLAEIAEKLDLDISDIKNVDTVLSGLSSGNAGYGNIDMDQLDNVSTETGLSLSDVQSIALELGYTVE